MKSCALRKGSRFDIMAKGFPLKSKPGFFCHCEWVPATHMRPSARRVMCEKRDRFSSREGEAVVFPIPPPRCRVFAKGRSVRADKKGMSERRGDRTEDLP